MSLHHGIEEGRVVRRENPPTTLGAVGRRVRAPIDDAQVLEHQESTRLQYGLVRRAVAWGWPEARVLVIDDDLGVPGERIDTPIRLVTARRHRPGDCPGADSSLF